MLNKTQRTCILGYLYELFCNVRINALYSQILYVVAFSWFSGCFQILMNIYVISYMNKYISALSIWYVKKLFYLFYIYLRSIRLNSQLYKLLCQGCMVPDIWLDMIDYTFDHNMMEDILKIETEITIVWLTISVLNTKTWCFVFSLFLILQTEIKPSPHTNLDLAFSFNIFDDKTKMLYVNNIQTGSH